MARDNRREILVGSQKGAMSESAVFTAVLLQTNGRLRGARPQPDDHGIDAKFYQPGFPLSLDVQIKACYSVDKTGFRNFKIDLSDIPRDPSFHWVLCVEGTQDLPGIAKTAWLVPGGALPARRGRPRMLHIAMRPVGPRRSKWDPYRIDFSALGPTLLEHLKADAGAWGHPLPAPEWEGLSDTAVGRITEDAFALLLLLKSAGRLCVFRPTADTIGLDLDVMALEGRVSAAVQVKGVFVEPRDSWVLITVRAKKLRRRPDRYIVVVPYLHAQQKITEIMWVVPEDRFAELARRQGNLLKFRASLRPQSGDRWREFRCTGAEVVRLFEDAIAVKAARLRP